MVLAVLAVVRLFQVANESAGCQSQGIAATPKHFVANEAENYRTKLNVDVDEQVLRELYMLPFQIIMKLCDPWCFMTR